MRLKQFIKKLKEISKKHGEKLKVVMADNIPAVDPIFSDKYKGKKVVITNGK